MKKKTPEIENSADQLELSSGGSYSEKYILRLYIAGMTPRSVHAISNIKKVCEEYLHGRYNLQVIDLYQTPQLAKGEQIIAAPTLIKKLPLPLRRIIGDMSNTERLLVGLDLRGIK
ncbi:MAG: circadian clock KaiB family protein [Bacteroidales bacterium]|nr:circadian clock KaiB family protein [Bacteroidales bacterium]